MVFLNKFFLRFLETPEAEEIGDQENHNRAVKIAEDLHHQKPEDESQDVGQNHRPRIAVQLSGLQLRSKVQDGKRCTNGSNDGVHREVNEILSENGIADEGAEQNHRKRGRYAG